MWTGAQNRDADLASEQEIVDALLALLDPDVVFHFDHAAFPQGVPLLAQDAQAVARLFIGRARETPSALVNGVVVTPRGQSFLLLDLAIVQRKTARIVAS